VTPSHGMFDRLTSPLANHYLGTSDLVLTDVIGQLEGANEPPSARVTSILGELNQVLGNLDHLLDDLDHVRDSRLLRGELRNMVQELRHLRKELDQGGDLPVNVPGTETSLSLKVAVNDVQFALKALATMKPLSRLPSADVVFAAEAGLPGVPVP
jgi:hypothetical protein